MQRHNTHAHKRFCTRTQNEPKQAHAHGQTGKPKHTTVLLNATTWGERSHGVRVGRAKGKTKGMRGGKPGSERVVKEAIAGKQTACLLLVPWHKVYSVCLGAITASKAIRKHVTTC